MYIKIIEFNEIKCKYIKIKLNETKIYLHENY